MFAKNCGKDDVLVAYDKMVSKIKVNFKYAKQANSKSCEHSIITEQNPQYVSVVGNEPNRMSYSRLISPKITHFIYSLLS